MSSIELVVTVVATGLLVGEETAEVVVTDDASEADRDKARTFSFVVPKSHFSKFIVGDEVVMTLKPRIAP